MKINQDFTQRIVIETEREAWLPSPLAGVERKYLDRDGNEKATATSLVRYAPGSYFSTHQHEQGEEILVLDGTFADEHGTYPRGTYLRNPRGTSHQPFSDEGCVLFVKLRQFDQLDRQQLVIDTNKQPWRPGLVPGLSVMPLHEYRAQHTALVKWEANTQFNVHSHYGGEEILVLEGVFYDDHGRYPKGSWIRSPHLSRHTPFTREEGATILVKTGHLPE